MRVPLLDLREQHAALRPELDRRLREVVDGGQFILGPAVARFEASVRAYVGADFAVGMSSGTDAQLAILMALGVGAGDAVVTTPYTFFATAGCVTRLGARPVFVDVDADTLNLSPEALGEFLATRVTDDGRLTGTGERVRAVVPVHLFGLCADLARLGELAAARGLPVLEDASQAIGAECPLAPPARDIRDAVGRAGAVGAAGWFSFFPSKNLGAFGDAGLATCRDADLDRRLRALRMHGMSEQYFHDVIGGNFRLDALQAAVLEAKLPHLDGWSAARRANAARYRESFARTGLLEGGRVRVPAEPWADCRGLTHHHVYHQYVIRVSAADRDALRAHLAAQEIGTAVYYPLPLHLQPCFRYLGYREGDFPHAEAAARESLALPIYPELAPEQIAHVVATVAGYFSR